MKKVFGPETYLFKMSLTQEERNRMVEVLGSEDQWFNEDLRKVPEKHKGLGYKWYPIVIKSDFKDVKMNVHPSINAFRGPDWDKIKNLDEKEITKCVVSNIMGRGHPDFYSGLSYVHTFVDPKEVEDAISYFKSQGLIGFMSAFDGISVEVKEKKFFFIPEQCREMDLQTVDDYSMIVSVELKFLETNNRIFNRMVKIRITN